MQYPAVIFDMDGTLLDNNSYHMKSWQAFFKNHGKILTDKEFKEKLSGINSVTTIRIMMGEHLSDAEVATLHKEKEKMYRTLITSHIKPIPGLITFLDDLKAAGISMGIATSATTDNIHFAMEKLKIEAYFKTIVNTIMVSKGKPDPEIFLTAAKNLHTDPENCVVFEDSLNGIRGAQSAGMKVIALATTHLREELSDADAVIKDYTQMNVQILNRIFRIS